MEEHSLSAGEQGDVETITGKGRVCREKSKNRQVSRACFKMNRFFLVKCIIYKYLLFNKKAGIIRNRKKKKVSYQSGRSRVKKQ